MNKPRGFTGQVRQASLPDLEALLDLHYRTFDTETNLLLLLGRRFMRQAFRWYVQSLSTFALVAEDSSGLLGYIMVNQGSYYAVFRDNWLYVMLAFLLSPGLLFHTRIRRRLGALLKGARKKRPADTGPRACLAYMALEQGARGRGAASTLVRAALKECQRRGWHDVVTSYHADNAPARVLFAMLGFKPCPELNANNLVAVRCDLSKAISSPKPSPPAPPVKSTTTTPPA